MKKLCLISALFLCISTSITAQVKIFSNGNIAIGSTTDPGTTTDVTKFYDEVILNNGFSVPTGVSVELNSLVDFYGAIDCHSTATFGSTTEFSSTVNFGEYGTANAVSFYGDVTFNNANSSADFNCLMEGSFSTGLTVSSFLTVYGTFTNYSDINLKKNIMTLEGGALEKITSLQGVTYNFNIDEAGQTRRVGFIAQELQKIFPDLVSEEKEGLAIKSLELLPYLVEAIKEQEEVITQQEDQISALWAEIDALRELIIANESSKSE